MEEDPKERNNIEKGTQIAILERVSKKLFKIV